MRRIIILVITVVTVGIVAYLVSTMNFFHKRIIVASKMRFHRQLPAAIRN